MPPFSTAFPRSITAGAETVIQDLPAPLPIGTTVSSNTYSTFWVVRTKSGVMMQVRGSLSGGWWLGGQKQKLEEKFVAFSKGPRSCIGRETAMLMLEKAVVG